MRAARWLLLLAVVGCEPSDPLVAERRALECAATREWRDARAWCRRPCGRWCVCDVLHVHPLFGPQPQTIHCNEDGCGACN